MSGKPLGSTFSIIMHIVQIVVLAVTVTVAFMRVSAKVDLVDQKVTAVSEDVDKITTYLGIWQPRAAQR